MCRILLVDDEQNVLSALKRDLTPLGCEIEAYTQPGLALSRAAEASFNLVISDYRMDGMNGVTLIKALKKLQPGMDIIMLSGLADLRIIMSALNEIEVFCYLSKPWDAEKLKTRVAEALKLRAVEQNNPVSRITTVPVQQPKGAMAVLEAKYPGITQPESDWKPS